MATRKTKAELAKEKEYALERLHKLLAHVDEVFTVVTWVNRTGEARAVKVLIAGPNGAGRYENQCGIVDISWYLSCIGLGKIKKDHGGVICGSADELVMNIAYRAFPEWECRGEWCGSNTHSYPPQEERGPGLMHTDGYRFHKVSI